MKPFNIERALAGDPVVTRCGSAVPFISHDEGSATDCCILARTEGQKIASFYSINGTLLGWKGSDYDLFMAPTKREAWVNVYPAVWVNCPAVLSHAFSSEEEAKCKAGSACLATIRIEWTE